MHVEFHGMHGEVTMRNGDVYFKVDGTYEPEEMALVTRLFGATDHVLLAGGGMGWLALWTALTGAEVEVYEAHPVLARVVAQNVALNGNKIPVHVGAIGAGDGTAEINETENWACSTMRSDPAHKYADGRRVVANITTPVHGINGLLERGDFNALALDIEGGELEVARAITAGNWQRLHTVLMEVHRAYIGEDGVAEIEHLLSEHGMRVTVYAAQFGSEHRGPYITAEREL